MPKHYNHLIKRARLLFMGAFILIGLSFLGTFIAFLKTPLIPKEGAAIRFVFPLGASVMGLSQQLAQMHLSHYPRFYWLFLSVVINAHHRLHAGEYEIEPGALPKTLLDDMVAARVVWRNLLFVEGLTVAEWRALLDQNPYLEHRTQGLSEKALARLLGAMGPLEGLFFPDTYRYTAGLSDLLILKEAYRAMQKQLSVAWEKRAPGLPYQNAYQALIVASMVEKEAKLSEDRPKIAGIMLKRLKMGMPLQIDATIIYGLGTHYTGVLKSTQLKIPGLYNTYLNKGLPPTPIANPGQASLEAALHPVMSKALFYVARGDGGHVFSVTLAQQNHAIEVYRHKRSTTNEEPI